MADMKYLNTRVQLKYDSYENWSKAENQKDLLPGEIAIAYLGPTHSVTSPDNGTHPVLFKVGPGKFNDLPWASALAADVYEWAKAESKPEYQASEIKGLDEYIAGEIQDTNTDTQYRFSTDGDKLVIHKTLYTLGVAGTEEKVGEYEFLTAEEVKAMIPDITASGDNEITLTANKHNVTAAHTTHAAGSAKTASTGSISGYGATGSIKVPKIVTNAAGHVTEISEETVSITMPAAPEHKTLTIGSKTYDTSADVAVTAADLGLSNAMHFVGALAEAPANPAAGDVYLNTATHKEYVYDETNGWVELGDEGSHALKTISITGTDGLTGGGTLESNREIKLSEATKASLALADNSKQKQTAVASKFTASAHVLSSLSQNENGDIAYEVKELAPADIGAQPAGDYALKSELPVVNDGKFTVSGTGALSGSGEMTANQSGNTTAALDVKEGGIDTARLADKAVITAKIADHAVGAKQLKAEQDYTGDDAEVWVFCCGNASTLI